MAQTIQELPRGGESIDLQVRPATLDDLPGIMEVERDWPEGQRAPQAKFEARLERFAEGVFVALVKDEVVGVTTSCLTHYSVDKLGAFAAWDVVTNDGWIKNRSETPDPNGVYVVSTGIKQAFRGLSIFPKLITAQIALSKRLQLRYCVTGAILEGYGEYCRGHGPTDARVYALLTGDTGAYIDPLLRKLQRVGFRIPDERHILPEYFASEDAHDWSVLMVVDNNSSDASSAPAA
jgi:hypothetical protein